jgi:hypothetical protein
MKSSDSSADSNKKLRVFMPLSNYLLNHTKASRTEMRDLATSKDIESGNHNVPLQQNIASNVSDSKAHPGGDEQTRSPIMLTMSMALTDMHCTRLLEPHECRWQSSAREAGPTPLAPDHSCPVSTVPKCASGQVCRPSHLMQVDCLNLH